MQTQVRLDQLALLVVCCTIQKQNHEEVLPMQLFQVLQKIVFVPVGFQTKQLRPIVRQRAVRDSSPMRTRRQNDGFTSLNDPDFTDFYVVDENAFVLNYDAPLFFVKTCQVGRVFFKNFLRSLSLE